VRAAKAVHAALKTRHPVLEASVVDALQVMPWWYARTYARGYVRLVDRHPLAWRWLYEQEDKEHGALGHALTVLGGRPLARRVRDEKPDLVVCTHFLAPEVLAREKRLGRLAAPIHVVITDHDCHRMWWQPEVDAYYVPSELVKARICYRFGVPSDRVHVTGIPIDAEFSKPRDVVAVRARYGLDPARPTVLVLSGGFAAGPLARVVLGIWADRPDVQVIAVCGDSARLRRTLDALPRPVGGILHALGFTDQVPDLMAACDLVVSKSGGLTTSEAMAMGRPLVASSAIPGQEERNGDAVVAAGAGVKAPTPEEVRWHVARLLSRPDELRAMSARARAFGRPHAADDVADRVAECLGVGDVWLPPAHGAPAPVPRRSTV
jgi:processive 1,2-diacylglycerol beta-glucosyltransferase